ncbi:MAG: formylmethanofuran dehydrogenase subunit A, partial [Planctomycetia bacterium]
MDRLCIKGGAVYDPAEGVDGVVQDVWMENGKIRPAPAPGDATPARVLDANGCVVMPGAIDLHSHIAGPKVNAGRKMLPEVHRRSEGIPRAGDHRSGIGGVIPTTFATGYLYAAMGYTTAFDAAIPGLLARHAHAELGDTPILDKGFYALFGNNHWVMKQLRDGQIDRVADYCAWTLSAVKGYAVKVVNPGGIENWKQISRKSLADLEQPVPHFGVSPREIVRGLAEAVDRLNLPHSVHLHCNNLGLPGNWRTTLATMEALEGRRGHFAHVQFHSYGGEPGDREFSSAAAKLVEYVDAHPNITVDVGHVLAGKTASLTGDAPFSAHLQRITGAKWFAADSEQESSCGVLPIEYEPQKSFVHAIQWAIGLEWYLLMKDPWRLAITSDHPNGAVFVRYPELI